MKHLLLTPLTALVLAAATQAQAQYIPLPTDVFSARDITPDGLIIVGSGNGGGYYWNWQQDPAPTFIGGNGAVAVSDDGSVIAGNFDDPSTGLGTAAIWTQANGWVSLGGLSGVCGNVSSSYDISGDGSTVVGLAWVGCSARGFRWTQATGMQELQGLVNGNNRASAIAADGSRIVGFAQGNFSRTPASWLPDTSGSVWNADVQGEVRGVSDDGSIVLGSWYLDFEPIFTYQAFYEDAQGLVILGTLNPPLSGWAGAAVDVSEDGNRIIGYDYQGLGGEAWVWSPTLGIERLQDKLTGLGVAGVPPMSYTQACTPDGSIIVGHTPFVEAWVVVLPMEIETYCTSKVASLGCLPSISSTGNLPSISTANPFDIDAADIVSQKSGLMFYGFNSAAIPFNGGTLCVQPPLGRTGVQFSGGTPNNCSGTYSYDFQTTLQAGTNPFLVAGIDVFAQYWFRDPGDPVFGVGLTDALRFQIQP